MSYISYIKRLASLVSLSHGTGSILTTLKFVLMEILFRFSVAFAALLLQSSFALQYREHKFFHGGKYNLSLVKDPSTGDLHFQAVAETLGWVGFGIAAKNTSMQEMDCIVAGVKNGVGYINVSISLA